MHFCQSCAMPMEEEKDYCEYCYKDGAFTADVTMEQMIEICVPHVLGGKPYNTEEEARAAMQAFFPQLKRWAGAQ